MERPPHLYFMLPRMDIIDGMTPDKPQPGDAFSKWRTDFGSQLASQQPEALATAAWDAALKVAWLLLEQEKEALLKQKCYEAAAAVRDCRERLEADFTSPGRWGPRQHWFEQEVEEHEQFFRRLSREQFEKARSTTTYPPGSAYAVALDRVLRGYSNNDSSE